MSLFESLNQQPQQPQNSMQMVSQLRANPAAILRQRGLNIPDGMNDPQQIINYLLQSGQVSNNRLQMAQKMMRR